MSMSMSVVGIKPADEKWRQMKAIWDACKKAGVLMPEEVSEYFDNTNPDASGVIVDLEDSDAVEEYNGDSENGLEIDLKRLPKDVTVVRFVCSY